MSCFRKHHTVWLILQIPDKHAGATADAFTLFERLEMQLEQHPGELKTTYAATDVLLNMQQCSHPACQIRYKHDGTAGQLTRAAVELAKLWRTDKYLRKLDVRVFVLDPMRHLGCCMQHMRPTLCCRLSWWLQTPNKV